MLNMNLTQISCDVQLHGAVDYLFSRIRVSVGVFTFFLLTYFLRRRISYVASSLATLISLSYLFLGSIAHFKLRFISFLIFPVE
jgi:hypothetical protein